MAFSKLTSILLLNLILTNTHCIRIGSIKQAQLVTNAPSIWLYNQSSWSQCLCSSFRFQSIVAFNSFSKNSSCQLFSNLSSSSFRVVASSYVTIYLLRPLPQYAPCCSNLNWLLAQMKSTNKSLSIGSIVGLALDTTINRLGTVASEKLQLVSTTSVNFLNISTNLPTSPQPITYHQGLFYVGIFPISSPYLFHIYSAANLTKIGNMTFTAGGPQRVVWLFNDTLVCILLQMSSSTSKVNFYNWPAKTLNYSQTIAISNAYGLAKASDNDKLVFITDGSWGGNVWQIQTTSPYNFTLFARNGDSKESPTAAVVDACDRLWVAYYGFGVRIYDIYSQALLAQWDLTSTHPGLYDIAMTDHFELYLADTSVGKLTRFGSQLQCTN